ncbi:MAG: hypothetical protein LLG00_05035 [Planctomycetaceae bacterium]|nr:hypothetical protein [Planctomycetaceae bacterium]
MVRRTAKWTGEALDHPRLWPVVEALAAKLLTVKTRLSGPAAVRIMRQAWGGGCLPYREMGPKWRRRFSVKMKAD